MTKNSFDASPGTASAADAATPKSAAFQLDTRGAAFIGPRLAKIEVAYQRALHNRANAYRRSVPDCEAARKEHERADRALDEAERLIAEIRATFTAAPAPADDASSRDEPEGLDHFGTTVFHSGNVSVEAAK